MNRLAKIKILAMDVDGTLTDGGMIFLGDQQVKVFNVCDGLGIRLALNRGLKIAWITGNASVSVTGRARTLGIEDVYQNSWVKSTALEDLAARHGIGLDEIAYIGDDLNDLPAFEIAGFSFAVSNACDELKARADAVTTRPGGGGAVREAIEAILKAKGQWEDAVKSFLEELKQVEAGKVGPEAVG